MTIFGQFQIRTSTLEMGGSKIEEHTRAVTLVRGWLTGLLNLRFGVFLVLNVHRLGLLLCHCHRD